MDLIGKGGHVRTVPIPDWVRLELNDWLDAAGIDHGKIFRKISRTGHVGGNGMSEKAVWHIVKKSASRIGVVAVFKALELWLREFGPTMGPALHSRLNGWSNDFHSMGFEECSNESVIWLSARLLMSERRFVEELFHRSCRLPDG